MNFRPVITLICLFCVLRTDAQRLSIPRIHPPSVLPTAQPEQTANQSTDPSPSGALQLMKGLPDLLESGRSLAAEARSGAIDTLYVGLVPNDTVVITGNYLNNGPILVFNDGVLIFYQANATIMGNIYVFQGGQLWADSSVISSPQAYFYQRSMIAANNGLIAITNSTLDFSGLSHNLAVVENAQVYLNNITNVGFTTAGVYGNGAVVIDGSNQAGEFIMTDSAQLGFNNAATVLLWHHVPDGAVVDVSFPAGASVANYSFNNSVPGVSGIGYDVQVTSCTDVMWALMPENGSDVTISGSTLRAIGLWFTGGDTVAVNGLVNNSNYTAFTAPLNDRNLVLNNTSLQTWSLYMFDTVQVNVTGCIVGEVGSMGRSNVVTQSILCDGSGGYYWTTDTTLHIAIGTTILGYIRSQGNGIMLLGYGSATAGGSAIENSVLVVTQSSLPQDPVPYDNSAVWRVHLNPPANLFVDTIVDINGTAFIDQGPQGSFIFFGSWDLSYAPAGTQAWVPISSGNTNEVHNGFLSSWNTDGLTPGTYDLRLNTFSNFGDSIDAVLQVTLLPSIMGLANTGEAQFGIEVIPQPASGSVYISWHDADAPVEISISDIAGRLVFRAPSVPQSRSGSISVPSIGSGSGFYFVRAESGAIRIVKRIYIHESRD
jgi:hypothetical protein